MNKNEKIQFVLDLCRSIGESVLQNIDKIPEDWDGIELRWLVQEYATSRFQNDNKKRKKNYHNAVINNNL